MAGHPLLRWPSSPAVGFGRAFEDRIPRWLVELRRLDHVFWLSNVPGRLENIVPVGGAVEDDDDEFTEFGDATYLGGIVSVQLDNYEVDLEAMTIPLLSGTVHLTPDIRRHFDPMTKLGQIFAKIALLLPDPYPPYTMRIWPMLRGSSEDVEIAFAADLSSFKVIEVWRGNPLFPWKTLEQGVRVLKENMPEGSEDHPYPIPMGKAFAVPGFPAKSKTDEEQVRWMYSGISLVRNGDTDPVSSAGFPNDDHPGEVGVRTRSISGLHYGPNKCLRDAFEKVGINAGWTVVAGTFAQNESGATQLESTAGTGLQALVWGFGDGEVGWNYEKSLSLTAKVEAKTPSTGRAVVFWNFVDIDNHARAEWPFGGKSIRVVVVEAGVETYAEKKKLGSNEDTETDFTIPDVFRLTLDITGGRVSAGVKEKSDTEEANVVEFGEVDAAVDGLIGIGARDADVRFHYLSQPSTKSRGATEADPNAGIAHFRDEANHSYVGERFKGTLAEPMFATFRRAHGVGNAGRLVERLIRDYSGTKRHARDDQALFQLRFDLGRFNVGSYFNEQQPIFTLISERLGPQFGFVLTQHAGRATGFMFDPTQDPDKELVFGNELLDLVERVTEFPKYSKFKAKFKYSAAHGRFLKKRKLVPDNFTPLRIVESRHGAGEFPPMQLLDVVDPQTCDDVLILRAMMLHQGQRVRYLQRTNEAFSTPLGMVVALTDEERGFDQQRAFLVGRENVTPTFTTNVYRTIHRFGEVGAGGASFGETLPPVVPPVDPEDFPLGSCWSVVSGAVEAVVDYSTGEPINAISDGEVMQSCSCGTTLSGAGGERFYGHLRASGNSGDTALGTVQRMGFRFHFYTTADCSTPPRTLQRSGTVGSGANNEDRFFCYRSADAKAEAGEVKMRVEIVALIEGPSPSPNATIYAWSPEIFSGMKTSLLIRRTDPEDPDLNDCI